MKTSPIILALVCMSAITSSAEWTVETHVDEMTDDIQYVIWTTGTVVKINSIVDYTPQLQIRLKSPTYDKQIDNILAEFELMFSIDVEGLVRRGAEVLYRIDAEDPVREIWTPATTRRGAFSPHPHELYLALKKANTFRLRYVTTLGDIRTTQFDVSGIERATQKIKEAFRQLAPKNDSPPPAPRDDAAVVTARNEKGSRAFARLSENAREEIAERTRKHAERKLKPKEFQLLTLQRRRHRLGTVWIQHFIADGKKWRTGFLESSGQLTQIDPSKLKTYISNSTPED